MIWTSEKYPSSYGIARGGYYSGSGTSYPASYRERVTTTDSSYRNTFRVSLYIKNDNVIIKNPSILANPSGWTNGNVVITIAYSQDSTVKEYSLDGTVWQTYSAPITITTNNTTVYARCRDTYGSLIGASTLTVANIDKLSPTVTFGTNGGSGLETASTTVTINDTGTSNVNASTLQYAWDTQNVAEPSGTWGSFTNGGTIEKEYISGTYYLWIKASDNAGNTVVSKSNAFSMTDVPLELGVIATENTTINGEMPTYYNPIIPKGFKAVNIDTEWPKDWNKGLVIEDTSGNQFVWVPVDGTDVPYAKNIGYASSYGATLSNTLDDFLPMDITEIDQISQYGGFYIARYEAMIDWVAGELRAASKKSIYATTSSNSWSRTYSYTGYLWNWINYDEAKMYSENMATSYGYDTSKVITTLVTGTQWDTTLKWIENSGKNVIDSIAWGNYSNTSRPADVGSNNLQVSGFSEYWKANNIYDIAGNTKEWTSEKYSSSYGIVRGGYYSSSGTSYPASYRERLSRSDASVQTTFRVSLYIKNDNIVIKNPSILANPSSWTNGNVVITITYPSASTSKEYSLDGTVWQTYSAPITITTNNTTVYAKCNDAYGNPAGASTLTVANIDKLSPTVAFGTNGGSGLETANTTVTVTDIGTSNINASTLQYAWDTQNTAQPSGAWSLFTNGGTIEKEYISGTYYLWIKASDNAGNTVVSKSNAFSMTDVPLELGVIATENTTINGEMPTYYNPIIPKGFKAINDNTVWPKDWNKGLVIEDASGNQFVWVPVDGTNVPYVKKITYPASFTPSVSNTYDDFIPIGITEADQISLYKGFYIARYEAMFDWNVGEIRAASKMSTNVATSTSSGWSRNSSYSGYLWNWINYTEAKAYSESMASSYGYDTSKIITTLVTGTQWDTTMKWMENSSANVIDSRTWGNYSNSTSPSNITGYGSLQVSGFSEYWKANNIYDIAGNTKEWTNERYSSSYAITRGGYYSGSGTSYPASYRERLSLSDTSAITTFRVALYIKDDNIIISNPAISADPIESTSGNVTVTVTYPSGSTAKEYSLDGTVWQTYTAPITITTNNTTVYARCSDAYGNPTGASTLTITNIIE
jgi:formylglycine-generating enzyme required for sulfatase activity